MLARTLRIRVSRRLPASGSSASTADQNTADSDLLTINGLSLINGLSMINGLAAHNGLSMLNGLSMVNGLVSGVDLMTGSSGRQTIGYLVRCALPLGHSIVKTDDQGVPYTFLGQIGVAPEWDRASAVRTARRT